MAIAVVANGVALVLVVLLYLGSTSRLWRFIFLQMLFAVFFVPGFVALGRYSDPRPDPASARIGLLRPRSTPAESARASLFLGLSLTGVAAYHYASGNWTAGSVFEVFAAMTVGYWWVNRGREA